MWLFRATKILMLEKKSNGLQFISSLHLNLLSATVTENTKPVCIQENEFEDREESLKTVPFRNSHYQRPDEGNRSNDYPK